VKILIIRQGALGDVIMATGIVRAIYEKYNAPIIDIATDYSSVFLNNIYVNRVGQLNTLTENNYDLTINLDMAYEMSPAMHAINAYALRADLNYNETDLHTELFVQKESYDSLSQYNLPEKFIVLHQRYHYWSNRNLLGEFYIDLASKIIGVTGYPVVQIGGEFDHKFGVIDGLLYDLTNKLSLHETAALIEKAKAFVGIDAGPMHIASSTNTPVVGLFTSVKAEYREPRNRIVPHINIASNIECYGCVETLPAPVTQYHCARGDDECTRRFSSDIIIERLKTLLC